jgi:phosphinothricin acetyltransferase
MRIEPAAERHAAAIAAIYADAARSSHVTFELVGPGEREWHEELSRADPDAGRMILVALGGDDAVLGYAKSGPHRPSGGYATTCETSIYVAGGGRREGLGGALYDALLERLDASVLRLAVAGVAEPNEASARLHLSRGFTRVGTFTGIGAKRGRAWDVTWYQRPLATPPLVEELRSAGSVEAAAALLGRRVSPDAGGVPILDPATGERLAGIEAAEPLPLAERLLLEWFAEALAPLFAGGR